MASAECAGRLSGEAERARRGAASVSVSAALPWGRPGCGNAVGPILRRFAPEALVSAPAARARVSIGNPAGGSALRARRRGGKAAAGATGAWDAVDGVVKAGAAALALDPSRSVVFMARSLWRPALWRAVGEHGGRQARPGQATMRSRVRPGARPTRP
ncbi:hypothetical protein AVMA1855_22975 [Acidovorax sp. SUPP1855]|uniref:hypothetical protein n=1 Tax=Acidovorax sp. SUPP1855 TaxID=431774 RepID=UPI0023DE4EBA|nr:hypothetical protein [Acidovorax sp. SUPP1855]GKS87069.1 hypothetical protein AVMA1855_22975 [Acidovorax sp. SUPP1855]